MLATTNNECVRALSRFTYGPKQSYQEIAADLFCSVLVFGISFFRHRAYTPVVVQQWCLGANYLVLHLRRRHDGFAALWCLQRHGVVSKRFIAAGLYEAYAPWNRTCGPILTSKTAVGRQDFSFCSRRRLRHLSSAFLVYQTSWIKFTAHRIVHFYFCAGFLRRLCFWR